MKEHRHFQNKHFILYKMKFQCCYLYTIFKQQNEERIEQLFQIQKYVTTKEDIVTIKYLTKKYVVEIYIFFRLMIEFSTSISNFQ